ncbi:MAG: hypothetical protein QJT81_20315 [Candidatus Thiothrix putei]|uniref:Uncharacterized protein n=1 Tax=Candidatus Thiothrix putei TaxID=3080811 RepID=A0AA95HD82_9GAMM|nr:MAG: hypothetical protein QJT81_20315 [Candidatus Thiothrix putei]
MVDSCKLLDNATRTVCFPEGKSHIDARLIPLAAGEIDIDASAARLTGAQTRIQVIWSVFHLLLAVVGGMMGGVILSVRYYWRQKQHHSPPTLRLMPIFVGAIGGVSIYFLLLGLVPMEISIPTWLKTYQSSLVIALLGGSGLAVITLLSGLSDSMENKLIEPMLSKIREKRCAALVDKLNRLYEQYDVETHVEERIRMERIIAETEASITKLQGGSHV